MTCSQLRTEKRTSVSRNIYYFKFFTQQNSLVHYFQGNFCLYNQIEFKLFFVNYGNSSDQTGKWAKATVLRQENSILQQVNNGAPRSLYLHIGTYCTYVPWNDGIARKVQAPSRMFLLQVDYQLSFLKYLIHEAPFDSKC